jgi:hypothetical protein
MGRGERPEWQEPEGDLAMPPLQIEPMLRLLLDHSVQFIVIGGFSLSVHGIVRATKDVDIVPEPSRANLRRLGRALSDLDAEPLLADDFSPRELGIRPDEEGLALGGKSVCCLAGRSDCDAAGGWKTPGSDRRGKSGANQIIGTELTAPTGRGRS